MIQPLVIKAALSTLSLNSTDSSTTETRRSSRQCTKPKQYNDYDIPARSCSASVLSSKRTASSLTVSSLSNRSSSDNSLNHKPQSLPTKKNQKRQKIKESPKQWPKSEHPCTALIEKITIPWPKYSIKNAVFNGTEYSFIKTCSLDSALFVLYYAYVSYSCQFRALFDRETKPIYSNLCKTFQLVESDGWDTARLYSLTIHKRLDSSTANGNNQYNLFDTVDENVFRYIRTMQEYENPSECLCEDCLRRTRTLISTDIALNYKIFACICGRDYHFTATMKVADHYYKYNDLHPNGIYSYDRADSVETVIYYLLL
ncbi:unnamed protein product [Didymodactylos carnosus]|uniref:Uncharacterized protein n=1 Tax=Didymodactylos carnosus TaxID=1234261 RepID=A0A815VNH4_9BILA|nr:unnamed protein product [Didymodactylos carnosus]CAF4394821.1 unnamed protein product [Didymodactylos carnosus]